MPFATSNNFGDGELSVLGKSFSILVSKTAIHKGKLNNICLHTCQAHLHPALQEKNCGLTAGVHGLSQESAAASQKSRKNKKMNCTRLKQNSELSLLLSTHCLHSSMGETGFPFTALLEILVRKCGIFVYPSHPLFLRAQHRGFLALPMQVFLKCHLLSNLHGSKSAGRGLGCRVANSVRGRAVYWPCGMWPCQHHGQVGLFQSQQHSLALSECIAVSAPPLHPPCPSHSTERGVKCQTQH